MATYATGKLLDLHHVMMEWHFPGDTCETHCVSADDEECWALQPVSTLINFGISLGFLVFLPIAISKGASLAQCTCIAAFGVFEIVHGLSHKHGIHGIRYTDYYLHTAFYFVYLGLFGVLSEKAGRYPTQAWQVTAAALVLVDALLILAYGITLYNIILGVAMLRFLVEGFLDYLDEASCRIYHRLANLQLVLLAMFVNEAFNCDTMTAVTSAKVPIHAFFESGAAAFFYFYTRFFMTCKGKNKK